MAWVGASHVEAGSGTTPTHAVGDLLVVVAIRWGNTTPPSLPAGWTSVHTGTNTDARRIGYKVATATNDSTGTWTNASALFMLVWSDFAAVGAAASNLSTSNAAQTPALTLTQPGVAHVGTLGAPDSGQAGTPTGTVSRWTDTFSRVCDTNGPVASWSAQTVANQWLAVSLELIPAATHVTGELLPVGASSGGHVTGELLAVGATAEVTHVTGELLPVGSTSVARVTGLLVPVGAEARSLGTWHEMIRTPEWAEAIAARDRELDAYTEFVDMQGLVVPVEVEGQMLERAPAEDVTVSFHGEQAEQWRGTAAFGAGMVPKSLTSPLDPRNGLRLRLWWGVLHKPSGAWLWACCGTLLMEDPKVTDSGTASVTVTLRDMLTMLSGAGYGGQPLDISGLYVHEAIRAIIDRAAPTLPVRIAVTDRKVPDTYEVAYQSALTDVIDLAELAGWVVRTDADGVVNIGPRPEPLAVVAEWSEGDDCPVEDLTRDITTSLIRNRVTVRSTHPDAVGVYYTAEDNDPSSPTYVYGPWGAHPASDVETDVASTVEGCKSIADMRLGRLLHPTEDVELTIMPRPDLGYRVAANVRRRAAGTTGGYRISSWDGLRLPRRGQEPPAMKVRMMTRTME